jgi:aminobenzoyl-glutamate utilization protein B
MFVWNLLGSQRLILAIVSLLLALTVFFNRASADSPNDAKRVAVDVVDGNAAQIATVGDVLYYFGEPGMQEYESSKYLKTTLEQIGLRWKLAAPGCPPTCGRLGVLESR